MIDRNLGWLGACFVGGCVGTVFLWTRIDMARTEMKEEIREAEDRIKALVAPTWTVTDMKTMELEWNATHPNDPWPNSWGIHDGDASGRTILPRDARREPK